MRKQLKMFAGFGMVAIAVCVLGTLYFQYSSVLVGKCIEWLNIKPQSMSWEELETLDEKIRLVYQWCRFLILACAFWLFDLAYVSISRPKATRACARWGMVGCRLGLVCILIGVVHVALLKRHGVNADAVSYLQGIFSLVSFSALGYSFLMFGKSIFVNRFLMGMCVIGAFGWFCGALEELLWLLPSSHANLARNLGDHLTLYCVLWYVTEACRLLPFVGVLVNAGQPVYVVNADEALDRRPNDGDGLREVWEKCAAPLFWLLCVAIPLCVVSIFSTYPSFSKHLFFISYQKNVLLFKLVCVVLGVAIGISNAREILSHLNGADLGRMFARWLEKFSRAVPAAERGASAARPEKAPAPTARDRLAELKQLLDDGLITQEEFDRKRASILAEM